MCGVHSGHHASRSDALGPANERSRFVILERSEESMG
jgi:hypothetical protein